MGPPDTAALLDPLPALEGPASVFDPTVIVDIGWQLPANPVANLVSSWLSDLPSLRCRRRAITLLPGTEKPCGATAFTASVAPVPAKPRCPTACDATSDAGRRNCAGGIVRGGPPHRVDNDNAR